MNNITSLIGISAMKNVKLLRYCFYLFLPVAILIPYTVNAQSQNSDSTDIYRDLKFRNIGPAIAGGRVSSVQGIPGDPSTYYIGAAGGGVWKTTDGGHSWNDIFKNEPEASIGDVTVAPSNPSLVWVGTGEANIRNDIVDGHGVYYSPDGGSTWQFKGLKDVGQISKIIVNPNNPDIVFVAAIGHAWAPNKDRGLFKTTDGGKTWKKVLFVNDTTGVSDVIFKPGNPRVMLAAAWQVVRRPWTLDDGGTGSGIYRSTDGGNTWTKLKNGLPRGKLGRIALAAAPSDPNHIYALIESRHGMLWDTEDGGNSWNRITNNHELDVRPFYFSTMAVAPNNENRVYFLSFLLTVSNNGGKSVNVLSAHIHPDHHAIWIDPMNPNRIIEGNDGGVYLSDNAGKNWHFCNNIPIEQFYEVAVDNSIPFNLGGGLQDNNAWYGPSNNLHGNNITGFNWFTVAGGDGEYVVPAPSNPAIIYAEAQNGDIRRLNIKTGVSRYIRPYYKEVSGTPQAQLKYRFNWTTPFAVSSTDANEVYIGANVLFKTMNGGKTWHVISPDLTRNDKSKQVEPGGPIEKDISGAETYDTIMSIGLSKQDSSVIWIGSDDGMIHVTRDGGKTWVNVTKNIPHMPKWARIYQIGVSPFNAGTAYIAVDAHMLDNEKPYIYKTDDFGQKWKEIDHGLPDGYPVNVVREDPNRKGFLVAGTDRGLYYSANDGVKWNRIKSHFPTAPVWDLKFVKYNHDLVVATHGRGLFILDDMRPLEEMTPEILRSQFHFFTMNDVYMFHRWRKGSFTEPRVYSVPNPPSGAIIDYYLPEKLKSDSSADKNQKSPVKIVISNTHGRIINTLWGPAKYGLNRFIWNLRYAGPDQLKLNGKSHEPVNNTRGPRILPGTYIVTITANNNTEKQTLKIHPDPHLPFDMAAARAQQDAAFNLQHQVTAMNDMLNHLQSIHEQIIHLRSAIKENGGDSGSPGNSGGYQSILDKANNLDQEVTALKDTLYNTHVQRHVGEDDIHYLTHFHSRLSDLMRSVANRYDQAPSEIRVSEIRELRGELESYLTQYNNLISNDVENFNQAATVKGVATILTGGPINIQ